MCELRTKFVSSYRHLKKQLATGTYSMKLSSVLITTIKGLKSIQNFFFRWEKIPAFFICNCLNTNINIKMVTRIFSGGGNYRIAIDEAVQNRNRTHELSLISDKRSLD